MTVQVKWLDIALGIPGDCNRCPVQRAIRRLGFKSVAIGGRGCVIDGMIYDLPDIARRFIERFDRSFSVFRLLLSPFTFELKL